MSTPEDEVRRIDAFIIGMAIGFLAGSIVFITAHINSLATCESTNKSCRIQTCARLVTVNGVSNCEEWKP